MFAHLPITGYLDRFSHRPGESFTAHVGLAAPGPARALRAGIAPWHAMAMLIHPATP